jgi:hypothetical protein
VVNPPDTLRASGDHRNDQRTLVLFVFSHPRWENPSDLLCSSSLAPGAMILLVSQGDRSVGFGVTAVPAENGSGAGSPQIGPLRSFRAVHGHIAFHKTRWALLALVASIGTYF